MRIESTKSWTPIIYALTAGLGLGLGYGVIRSFHLGLIANLLSLGVIALIQLLIFRSGRASSYSTAQSWAQSQVDIAMEVVNTAVARANALSNAYASAIANSTATASNEVIVNVNDETSRAIEQLTRELAQDEKFNAQGTNVAMGELDTQKLTDVRKSTNSQGRVSTPLFKG